MRKSLEEQIKLIEAGECIPENTGLFGVDITEEEASLVIVPVPWDATASYGLGTSKAAPALLEASYQIDHHDLCFNKPYQRGLKLLEPQEKIAELNTKAHKLIDEIRANHVSDNSEKIATVNEMSAQVNSMVYEQAEKYLNQGKAVGVLGGDHSSPYGLIKTLAERHESFGILHIDAHFDLRSAYEGLHFSHASIMDNVLKDFSQIKKFVSFGIRDFCTEEFNKSEKMVQDKKSLVYFDREIHRRQMNGERFSHFVKEALNFLPEKVYLSFDIDGLQTQFCPSTGTPVPGGLHYNDAVYLIEEIALQGKQIIGFDLCEMTPAKDGGDWDQNVAMRLLYKICGAVLYNDKILTK